jgi:hypothetical protein
VRFQILSNAIFAPINFEKDSIAERLREGGFCTGKKTLVLLEGVLALRNPLNIVVRRGGPSAEECPGPGRLR